MNLLSSNSSGYDLHISILYPFFNFSLASSPRSCTQTRPISPLPPHFLVLPMLSILVGCIFCLFQVLLINVTRKRPQYWKLWKAWMFHWRFFWKVLIFGERKTKFYNFFNKFNIRLLISIPWPGTMKLFKSQYKAHNEYFLLHTFISVGLWNNFLKLIHCFLRRVPESWRLELFVKPICILETMKATESIFLDKFMWDPYTFKYITIERIDEDLKELLNANIYKKVTGVNYWGETLWIHKESVTITKGEIDGVVDKQDLRSCWKMGTCCNWSWNVGTFMIFHDATKNGEWNYLLGYFNFT